MLRLELEHSPERLLQRRQALLHGLSLLCGEMGLTPSTVQQYAKATTETMRDVVDAGDVSALCWLYGYSRALQDIDERLARKKRSIE